MHHLCEALSIKNLLDLKYLLLFSRVKTTIRIFLNGGFLLRFRFPSARKRRFRSPKTQVSNTLSRQICENAGLSLVSLAAVFWGERCVTSKKRLRGRLAYRIRVDRRKRRVFLIRWRQARDFWKSRFIVYVCACLIRKVSVFESGKYDFNTLRMEADFF